MTVEGKKIMYFDVKFTSVFKPKVKYLKKDEMAFCIKIFYY